MRSTTTALTLACVAALGLSACGGSATKATTSTVSTAAEAPAESPATATASSPTAAPVAAGTAVESVQVPSTAVMTDSEPVLTPDGRYTVQFGTTPTIEDGGVEKAAPEGGVWLLYTITREKPTSWESPEDVDKAGQSTRVSMVRGGQATPVAFNKDDSWSGARAVALDGDGKDVGFRFGYDGLDQDIAPDGKRDPQVAAASYLPRRHGEGADLPFAQGGTGKGMKAQATLDDLEITVSAYDKAKKWAAPGKAWVVVTGSVDETTPVFLDERSTHEASYDTVMAVADVTLAGVKPVAQTAGEGLREMRFLWELPVEQVKDVMPLTMAVRSEATRQGMSDMAPLKTTLTYTFTGDLGLTE